MLTETTHTVLIKCIRDELNYPFRNWLEIINKTGFIHQSFRYGISTSTGVYIIVSNVENHHPESFNQLNILPQNCTSIEDNALVVFTLTSYQSPFFSFPRKGTDQKSG